MSKKKASGASQHVSPSGKRLGVKVSSGQIVKPGMILVRQNGTKVSAGKGVNVGRDFTIYSKVEGFVKFGKRVGKKIISVISK